MPEFITCIQIASYELAEKKADSLFCKTNLLSCQPERLIINLIMARPERRFEKTRFNETTWECQRIKNKNKDYRRRKTTITGGVRVSP